VKKIRTLKLGVPCEDIATGLKGQATHWIIDMSHSVKYLFQPEGLNHETGQPVEKIHLDPARIKAPKNAYEDVEVPVEILGTQVTDSASGFTGMAITFVQHVNGCFHVQIQPPGRLPRTNSPIERSDFALIQCVGDAIPKKTEKERKKEKGDVPSPTGDGKFEPSIPTGKERF
jgi:hypothetical protein